MRFLSALLCLATFVFAQSQAVSQSNKSKNTESHQRTTADQGQQNQPVQSPITINQFYSPPETNQIHESRQPEKQKSFLETLNEYLLTFFTFLLFIATGILA